LRSSKSRGTNDLNQGNDRDEVAEELAKPADAQLVLET
jgi:hypothetical protein